MCFQYYIIIIDLWRWNVEVRKLSHTVLFVMLAAVVLTGCGVPQEDYDKVVGDLSSAQSEIQGLDTELALSEEQVSTLDDDLTAYENEYNNLQVEYDSLQSEFDDLWAESEAFGVEYEEQDALMADFGTAVESASVYMAIVMELYTPAFTQDELSEQATIDAVKDLVEQTGDTELQTKFDTWSQTSWNRNLASEILIHSFLKIEELLFE
jgi:chromosome segregation ATPase